MAATGTTRAATAARKEADLAVVREIVQTTNDPDERVRMWVERTGKSRATLYRRMGELNA